MPIEVFRDRHLPWPGGKCGSGSVVMVGVATGVGGKGWRGEHLRFLPATGVDLASALTVEGPCEDVILLGDAPVAVDVIARRRDVAVAYAVVQHPVWELSAPGATVSTGAGEGWG